MSPDHLSSRTLREKLFREGPYLPSSHPAAAYRDIRAVKRRAGEAAVAAPRQTVEA
ncbi:hypothetical protein QA633_39815 [Bradyrhizobium barranii]|uniref:hypothetical protein n=1 Tax=Bradyrhizobium barranii TaxID=2992140 RepID=UPI0024AFB3C9|nr:hypothetical protein [Bradyrhizobium barranii]WFT94349.1 hypothetical protein QA633_39815 [Bradyrhizobium barranii]